MTKKITLKPNIKKIVDGLVSQQLIQDVHENLMSPVYSCIGISNKEDQFPFWVVRLDNKDIASVEAFSQLWTIVDSVFCHGKYEPYHILVNANNFGDCPMVHTDLPPDKAKDSFTIIYYAHDNWHHNWAGETVLLNNNRDDIVQSVYPRPGRFFVFDSAIPHVARTPTRVCTQLRLTIAFRVTRIKNL